MGLGENALTITLKGYTKVSTNKIYASKHWTFRKKLKDDYLRWFLLYKDRFPKLEGKINLDEKHFRWQLNADPMATEKLADGIRLFARDLQQLQVLLADFSILLK